MEIATLIPSVSPDLLSEDSNSSPALGLHRTDLPIEAMDKASLVSAQCAQVDLSNLRKYLLNGTLPYAKEYHFARRVIHSI